MAKVCINTGDVDCRRKKVVTRGIYLPGDFALSSSYVFFGPVKLVFDGPEGTLVEVHLSRKEFSELNNSLSQKFAGVGMAERSSIVRGQIESG